MSAGSRAVQAAGVSLWLDDLDRGRLLSGGLQRMVDDGVISGVTTNPSIFAKAVRNGGDTYAPALTAAAAERLTPERAVRELVVDDVRAACDVLAPVHDRTAALDGFVSLEVDPRLAHDTHATITQARELWSAVDRPNLMIKVPATQAGLPAITAVLADGINVNVTLIFSLDRYADVRQAHRDGLELARANGHDLRTLASVASFFVSRLDAAVDPRVGEHPLRGRSAVANALRAYSDHHADLSLPAWRALADAGAQPQRPLWASTGTKDPSYSPVKYVAELLTPGSVNTVPAATLDEVLKTGDDVWASMPGLGGAPDPRELLADAGVSYDDVVDVLERDGVDAFIQAWEELLNDVAEQLRQRAAD
jgi:transaldolase